MHGLVTSSVEVQIPEADEVTVIRDTLKVELSDGRAISVPLDCYSGLDHADP